MEKYDKFFLDKCPCSKTGMLVFEQGNFSRKNLTRAIFASVNYFPSALVLENLSYFPFTPTRKTCQGKTCQRERASVYSQQGKLASVNEALQHQLQGEMSKTPKKMYAASCNVGSASLWKIFLNVKICLEKEIVRCSLLRKTAVPLREVNYFYIYAVDLAEGVLKTS